jgi:hypothetical protein
MASCNDRRKLAEQFAIAAREHSEAIARLVVHEGTPTHAEFSKLRSVLIEAQERCETAGVEFEQHVAMHDCDVIMKTSRARAHVAASVGV